jgi:hypothetical protein
VINELSENKMTHKSRINIPHDAKLYRFPRSLKNMMIVAFIFFIIMLVSGLALPIIDPKNSNVPTVTLVFSVFTAFAYFTWRILKIMYDIIAVNPSGISCLAKYNESVAMNWGEITSIKAHDVLQHLVLSDATGTKSIKLEYQLMDFEELRELVQKRTFHLNNSASQQKVFTRVYYITIIFVFGAVFFAYCAVEGFRSNQNNAGYILLVFSILQAGIALFDTRKVVVEEQAIRICYVFWTKIVPYSKITDIFMKNINDGKNEVATVIIKRSGSKDIKLSLFRGGSLALYNSIRTAWTKAINCKAALNQDARPDR